MSTLRNLSPTEAVQLQRKLQAQIKIQPYRGEINYIGGVDVSFNKYSDVLYAAIVVLEYDTLEVVARSLVQDKMTFPYIPGLLSFREIPALLKAWEQLTLRPEVVCVDGHGIIHPRRMGIAAHFGLLIERPTVGFAKKMLVGTHGELAEQRGNAAEIRDGNETLGYAVRTKNKVKPMYVSPGHLLSLEQSKAITLHCARGYRMPEPTRQAHLHVNEFRKGECPAGELVRE